MAKKLRADGTPWVSTTERVPEHKQKVVIDYVTKEAKSLVAVGWFDNTCGWILHDTMRLPDGWRVYWWMPIPETPHPF